jgi:CubicO group peptidase (beta-lactamase class C family)
MARGIHRRFRTVVLAPVLGVLAPFLGLLALFSLLDLPGAGAAEALNLERQIDAYVAPLAERHLFSGVVLLAKGDQVLVNRAYGMANVEFGVPNTPETRFPIASITKRFTLLVLRRLADEKKLSFADPLARWVPDFPSADKITLEQLANHTSGIRDPDGLRQKIRMTLSTAEVVEHLKAIPLASPPGETYSYTTANYALLAHVIERVTGRSFADVLETYIYAPAGMRDSGELTTTAVVPRLASGYMPDPLGRGLAVCGPEDTSWKAGGGSSYSTTADLHRFLRALYAGKLSSVPAAELFSRATLLDRPVFRSSGSFPGANAHAAYFPQDEVAVVVLANNYAPMPGSIAEAVARIHFGLPYQVPAAPQILPGAALDARVLGRYRLEGFPRPFSVELRGEIPIVRWNPTRESAFQPTGERTWFMPFDWALVTFEPDYKKGVWTAPWAEKPLAVTRVD